ncbi:hypothetical protein BaRGS_00025983, partial [Batillaria attramentaria]
MNGTGDVTGYRVRLGRALGLSDRVGEGERRERRNSATGLRPRLGEQGTHLVYYGQWKLEGGRL